ncbi:NAD(+) diphosphatase [Nocardioides mesophilus]|uniref:NAD(+) diphosphatase n=2 Tax=Nocardioides mesophilus TaxID=433659 RepID=A0A7G9RHJ4_9ACTN|nr:NAD(+) diphosphatase [Nocardioides mesophilus]
MLTNYPHQAPIALSVHAHNRVAGRRTDQAWLEQVWADPGTRVLVLHDAALVVPDGADEPHWVSPADAPAGQRVLLGEYGDQVRFAVLAAEPPAGTRTEPLRAFVHTLDADEAALTLHAVALAEWHGSHRFCPRCGGAVTVSEAGHVLVCDSCGRSQFPRTDPAVIMLVTDGEDRCLLGRQERWPEGRYSTLAGFVEPGESLEQAVAREVEEEVGVVVEAVDYFGNQPWPFPASLMVGFFASAATTDINVDGAEISDARWFTREEMRAEAEAGTLLLPGGISISRSLVETWYGGTLPGQW